MKLHIYVRDHLWRRRLGRPYKLYTQVQGTGADNVVLIHGLANSHKVWTPLVALIEQRYRVIMPDLLGFGLSPVPTWGEYDVTQHAKHVAAAIRTHASKPVTIVAHSMGCLIAVHVAYTQPHLVSRLILYEPPLFADIPNSRTHARVRKRYFALFEYIARHPELVFKNGALRRLYARISGISLSPDTWIPFERSLRNTIMRQQAYDELHDIRKPTTIVQGRLDMVVPRHDVRDLLAANPYIHSMTVNRLHGVSARAAQELARILEAPVKT